ncbi:MAG TPA: hypothetical protein PK014_13450 [Thermoanaerobaculia bacterium]|nr:hypothetical protein [Thermoanaerobaculia bacterium]HUM31087.1 hypothetical protein [Thermoanaerobaculia bacterium]HXK69401.1 hypothetical protein [Thermoanaerobaculia bacterium]
MNLPPHIVMKKALKILMIIFSLVILGACTFGSGKAPSVPASYVPAEPITLESVNREWTGARAQIRYPFKIEKGSDSEGWSESKWAKFPQDDTEVRFMVTNRDSLRPIIPKKKILVGASLICDGWSLRRPSKGKDLQVDFHFEKYSARARIIFEDKDLEDLPDAERFLRLQILKLYGKSEQLSSVPLSAPGPGYAPPAATAPTAPSGQAFKPQVEILSTSVQPVRVRAGEQVDLVIHYRVQGIPPSTSFEAVELRALYMGDKKLASFRDPIARGSGSFTSSKKVKVPSSAKPGVYRFTARIEFAGSEAEAEAIFEVQ